MLNLPGKALSITHSLVGISSLLGPYSTQAIFQLNPAPSSSLIARLFGSRDLLIGAAIWTARSDDELRRTLLAVCLVNAIDVASTAVSLLEGNVSYAGAALAGGGAAVLFLLGLAGLPERDSAAQ